MQTAGLSGLQRFDLIFWANLLAAVIMLAGAFWLPLGNDNPAPLFGLMAVAAGAASLPGLSQTLRFRGNTSLPKLPTTDLVLMRNYALNMWLIALLWALVWSRGELTIVRYYLGDAGVASYSAALTLFSGAVQGVMLGLAAVAPQLTRLLGDGYLDEALATAKRIMDYQLLVCGMGASVLICLGPELLSLIFGMNYREQSGTLATLSVGLIAMTLANQNHLLQIATNGRFSRNSSIFGLLLLGGLATTMAPSFGVEGVALARSATVLLLAALSASTFYLKWGSSGISIQNLVIVFGMVVGTVFIVAQASGKDLFVRCLVLTFNLVCLLLLVRNANGRSTLLSLLLRVRG
jgi:O-antigen/teichoic acid export membrane protein